MLEVEDIVVGNAPGNWSVPMALRIDRARWNFGNLGSFLSTHPGGLMRLGCLEFTTGFRIKVLEQIELEGMVALFEDAPAPSPDSSEGVLRRGELRKEPLNAKLGTRRLREFVLQDTLLSWYEPGELGVGETRSGARPKGKLRLYPSSVVEVGGVDDPCSLTLISSADTLTMVAATTGERDGWVTALQRVVDGLASGAIRPSHSNAPWLEALVAEDEVRKLTWRRHAQRRRSRWRQRWQQPERGEGGGGGGGEGAGGGGAGGAADETEGGFAAGEASRAVLADDVGGEHVDGGGDGDAEIPAPVEKAQAARLVEKRRREREEGQGGAWWQPAQWLEGMGHGARWVEQSVSAHEVRGEGLEEVIEYQIGVSAQRMPHRARVCACVLVCVCVGMCLCVLVCAALPSARACLHVSACEPR